MEHLKGKGQRSRKEEVIAKHKGVPDSNSISRRPKQSSWDKQSSPVILNPLDPHFRIVGEPTIFTVSWQVCFVGQSPLVFFFFFFFYVSCYG